MEIRLGNYHLIFERLKEKPRPLPRLLSRLSGHPKYHFISPLKEIEKKKEALEQLPHPIEQAIANLLFPQLRSYRFFELPPKSFGSFIDKVK